MNKNEILKNLDIIVPNPICELLYTRDYELLIATVLSSQSLDKTVNKVTKVLFSKYDIYSLKDANLLDIEKIIYSVGSYKKKAKYIISIAKLLVKDYDGKVPCDRKYLENLPGVGRKTCNLVLSNLYNIPLIVVDTHVKRVSKRLGLTKEEDPFKIEQDLMNIFPKDKWNRLSHQLVLFGRYICKSKNPLCSKCPFKCKK